MSSRPKTHAEDLRLLRRVDRVEAAPATRTRVPPASLIAVGRVIAVRCMSSASAVSGKYLILRGFPSFESSPQAAWDGQATHQRSGMLSGTVTSHDALMHAATVNFSTTQVVHDCPVRADQRGRPHEDPFKISLVDEADDFHPVDEFPPIPASKMR
jgi:hypothetical protein